MTASADSRDQGRVRTYHARRGRLSPLTRRRLEQLLPPRSLPSGMLVPETVFGRRAPLVLEIGCGHGAAAVAYASTHPSRDVLAVDVHPPATARMLAAAEAAGVPNLRVEIGDAVALLGDRVGPGRLSAVHLFFPDPWPKRAHVRRRLISTATLALLENRLTATGFVLVATDSPAYVEHVQKAVDAQGGFVLRATERPSWRPVDGFERKALEAGRAVVDLRLDRA